jgi:uncharacterized protein (DUF1800 family)
MELFCLGEGNYSEKDVQELARCFTGWEVKRNQFRFNRYQHDEGAKQLLGASDIESGEQAIDAVLASPHAARFIVGKLFRYFLADEPAPPAELLEPLAQELMADSWHVGGVVRKLLGSQLMFSPVVRARKIRSPIDWAMNWSHACEMTTNLKKLGDALSELGQAVFYPPNVKGWDGGRTWLNSNWLLARQNFAIGLVTGGVPLETGRTKFASKRRTAGKSPIELTDLCTRHELNGANEVLDFLSRSLLAQPPTSAERAELLAVLGDLPPRSEWSKTAEINAKLVRLVSLLVSMPQYQLS